MRCVEIQQELSSIRAASDPAPFRDHLKTCPECAAWATQIRQQNELWESTRPWEPSDAQFAAVWSRVSNEVASPKAPRFAVRLFGEWRRPALVAACLAQAAAVLFAALALLPRQSEHVAPHLPVAPGHAQAIAFVDVAEGESTFIRLNDGAVSIVRLDPVLDSDTETVAAEMELLNGMETIE